MPRNDEDAPDHVFLAVQQSYFRCCEADGFFDSFYARFLGKNDEISPKFAGTDFKKQNNLLKASLYMLVLYREGEEAVEKALEQIGRTHGRDGYDIRPELYELWLDSLCETVEECDPQCTPELVEMWRTRMRGGIDYITSMYRKS